MKHDICLSLVCIAADVINGHTNTEPFKKKSQYLTWWHLASVSFVFCSYLFLCYSYLDKTPDSYLLRLNFSVEGTSHIMLYACKTVHQTKMGSSWHPILKRSSACEWKILLKSARIRPEVWKYIWMFYSYPDLIGNKWPFIRYHFSRKLERCLLDLPSCPHCS